MRNLTMLKWLWLSLLAVILDQGSKLAITNSMQLYQSIQIMPYFRLTYVHNTGAAFSFLSEAGGWQRWLFAGLAMVMSSIIAVWLKRLKPDETLLAMLREARREISEGEYPEKLA